MLYALIFICLGSEPVCDDLHAIWADQSPSIFDTEDECQDGAKRHVMNSRIPELKEGTEYQIEITCTFAEPPDGGI